MKIGRNVSLSQVPRPFNLNRCDIVVIVSATVPMCKDNVQRGGEKRTKSPGLARVRKPSCNTRHPQFTGNQRCECFVAVRGDEPDAPFIPRCHRRIISPRAHTHTTQRASTCSVSFGTTGSLRGTRNKHAPRITISKNRSATPRALARLCIDDLWPIWREFKERVRGSMAALYD